MRQMTTAFDDPLAPAGAQFPLGRPDTAPPCWDEPSPPGVRTVVLLDLAAGPPTAPTIQTVDDEDPPSSEDWKNDYTSDEPFQP
jgi:hypothetical protein